MKIEITSKWASLAAGLLFGIVLAILLYVCGEAIIGIVNLF